MKPVIGILENLHIANNNRPSSNYYKLNELYARRVKEAGGIPVGVIDLSEEALDKCDGFLVQGGDRITINHYKMIEYAIQKNKPLLGICAGMQAIVLYDRLVDTCIKEGKDTKPETLFNRNKEFSKDGFHILKRVPGHCSNTVDNDTSSTYDELLESKHEITIDEDSNLYSIYKKNKREVVSLHRYGYSGELSTFKAVAKSNDNVIEAIEYKNIIGVQFHPEIEYGDRLFDNLINKAKEK